jgi:hypothetical protein
VAKNWEIRVRGDQREPLDPELMAQLVIMLARQLEQETMAAHSAEEVNAEPGEGTA